MFLRTLDQECTGKDKLISSLADLSKAMLDYSSKQDDQIKHNVSILRRIYRRANGHGQCVCVCVCVNDQMVYMYNYVHVHVLYILMYVL